MVYLFKEVYDPDNSSSKEASSKLMWAIALLVHPSSDFADLGDLERERFIKEDYLKQDDFSFESPEIIELIEKFSDHCITREQRFLYNLGKKLDERDRFLANIPYNEGTFDLNEKALKSTKDIMGQYLTIKSMVSQQDSETYGAIVESATEKGDI